MIQEYLQSVTTREDEWVQLPAHHIIEHGSDDYPPLLAAIPDPPERLYVAGSLDALHMPSLAIVGSRNPTRGGRQNAYEFARHLATAGLSIVSGLALGIDAAAHEGALHAGAKTVAFLGHGIDSVYPPQNEALAERIRENGALCSEYPLGSPPRKAHFPQRNRLISGLCLGTLVVEAARQSGSLISARLASEQGREVFAIPGSIHNPLSRGCHQLIRQGAKLVESADDIFSELGPMVEHLKQVTQPDETPTKRAPVHDKEYGRVLNTLSYDPVSADEIAVESGLTIEQVSSMLLILELEEKVDSLPGGRYSRRQI